MRSAVGVLALAITYLILTGSASVKNSLVALVIGAAITWVSTWKHRSDTTFISGNVWFWIVFAGATLRDVFRGTAALLGVVLGWKSAEVGLVEVPIGERSPRGVAISGLIATLTPGTVLVDVDEERNVLVFSVIDARDPAATRADIQKFYEQYQKRILP